VFVTDLGGGGWTPAYQVDQSRWIDAHLPLSEYAARSLPGRPRPHHVIYGGVDLDVYRMRPRPEHDGSLVFLGRILPHKGVHFLIDAAPADRTVHVIGPAADAAYLADLKRRAHGKRVEFHHGLSDADVVGFLQRAMALVHPTPVDEHGDAGAHELFGLALVEAMACGCPVIASNAASLPEIVQHGSNGFLVPPSDVGALGVSVGTLENLWIDLSPQARRAVETRFTWNLVAERCISAMHSGGN
jgi:glycosyltransferase involved in cell wall biosynthesis